MFKNTSASICKCPDTFYGVPDFQTDYLQCLPCDKNECQNCDGTATTCTSCNSTSNLYGQVCVTDCKAQLIPSYQSPTENKCLPCGQYCLDCVNSTYCKPMMCEWREWELETYHLNGQCRTECPSNSLYNDDERRCDLCLNNCAVCLNSISNCIVCQTGYVLNNAQCGKTCPDRKYPDTTSVCQICPD